MELRDTIRGVSALKVRVLAAISLAVVALAPFSRSSVGPCEYLGCPGVEVTITHLMNGTTLVQINGKGTVVQSGRNTSVSKGSFTIEPCSGTWGEVANCQATCGGC